MGTRQSCLGQNERKDRVIKCHCNREVGEGFLREVTLPLCWLVNLTELTEMCGEPKNTILYTFQDSKRTERQYAHPFPVKSRLRVASWPLLSGRQSWFLSRSSILAHTFIPRLKKVATTQQDPRAFGLQVACSNSDFCLSCPIFIWDSDFLCVPTVPVHNGLSSARFAAAAAELSRSTTEPLFFSLPSLCRARNDSWKYLGPSAGRLLSPLQLRITLGGCHQT